MRIAAKNPLLWLLLLLTAWACLAAPPCEAKTASGQNLWPETASSEMTGWEAAPRLGFGDLAAESVSDSLVATESGTVAAGDSAAAGSPIDYAHAIGADYSRAGNPTGGHSLLNGDVQIVPGTQSAPDAYGVYQATIQVPDPANPGQWITKTSNNSTNTMFPANWDAATIQSEVDAAWNSPLKTVTGSKWNSFTPSGVQVGGFLAPRVTVYPIYQP